MLALNPCAIPHRNTLLAFSCFFSHGETNVLCFVGVKAFLQDSFKDIWGCFHFFAMVVSVLQWAWWHYCGRSLLSHMLRDLSYTFRARRHLIFSLFIQVWFAFEMLRMFPLSHLRPSVQTLTTEQDAFRYGWIIRGIFLWTNQTPGFLVQLWFSDCARSIIRLLEWLWSDILQL